MIDLIRQEYGYDKVLQLATYKTEGDASSILTACRGLGIDNIVASNMANTLDSDYSLKDQLLGNPKENIKPNSKLVNLVSEYDGLQEMILELEGLINSRSSHAGGIVVFNRGYVKEGNALMKTTSGADITQYDADDTEFLGGMKIDVLAIEALTKLRVGFDTLLKEGLIEWDTDLKTTYNKYFHPDVLNYTSQEMFDMLYNGEVTSAFQFNTDVGSQTIRKVNARSFDDLSTSNALMRLTSENTEQLVDKYVRFDNDINEWYQEMEQNGLNDEEIEILKRLLLPTKGICATQETLMKILMDKEISQYPLGRANKFRKLATKSKREELEEEEYPFFKEQVVNNGHSQEFVDYIWNYCLVPQMQYSFAEPHIVGYTLITLQEMNLCYKFSPLYWQTASLIVDSGVLEEKGVKEYGKIARASNSLRGTILPPDINESDLIFTVLPKENRILFGLGAISNIPRKLLPEIMKNRPYNSMQDFMDKTGATINQMVTLIKAGAFNRMYNRTSREIMIQFINEVAVKPRKNLTLSQFERVYEDILGEEYKVFYDLYMFRKALNSKKAKNEQFDKDFLAKYSNQVEYEFNKDGRVEIDKNSFERFYDKQMEPIRELLKTDEVKEEFTRLEKRDFWKEKCMGSIESWEMETISFYSDKHELDYVNPEDLYPFPIVPYSKLKDNAKGVIAGTVVDKNKAKSIIYVATQDDVIAVKMWRNYYYKYDEVITNGKKGKNRIVFDDSWFERGSLLILIGRKSGDGFFLDNRRTNFSNPIYKIDINGRNVDIVRDRVKGR